MPLRSITPPKNGNRLSRMVRFLVDDRHGADSSSMIEMSAFLEVVEKYSDAGGIEKDVLAGLI